MTSLRPYQTDAVDAVHQAWVEGTQRPVIAHPVGAGKTVTFARLAADVAHAGGRAVVLAHRHELLQQSADKIRSALRTVGANDVSVDTVAAGSRLPDHAIPGVTVASIPTLARRRDLGPSPDLVIVDEAHHAGARTWRETMERLGCWGGETRVLGVSATLWRADGTLPDIWDKVVHSVPVGQLIDDGYLVPAVGRTIATADLTGVASTAGDLSPGALTTRMQQLDMPTVIAEGYDELARRNDGALRRGIIFVPTVDMTSDVVTAMRARGIDAEAITGTTPTTVREAVYERVRQGHTTVLVTVAVLTEGFDLPALEVAVLARPTTSPALYTQMIGRILRPSLETDKSDALVLDVAGTTRRHRLATLDDLDAVTRATDERERQVDALRRTLGMEESSTRKPARPVFGDGQRFSLLTGRDLSEWRWLRSAPDGEPGAWFVPLTEGALVVWPTGKSDDQAARVVVMPSQFHARDSWAISPDVSWDEAVEHVERQLRNGTGSEHATIAMRGRSWMKRRPGDSMVKLAQRRGIDVDDKRSGELSDDIAISIVGSTINDRLKGRQTR